MDINVRKYHKFCMFSAVGILAASFYPLWMGTRVISDMLMYGSVAKENYPKYIIPYTPICIAVIIGLLLMPACIKLAKRFALAAGATISSAIFLLFEFLFEQKVVVTSQETVVKLEDWQMYMCYVPPGGWGELVTEYKSQTAVEILMGEYSPAFKLHFYIISLALILCVLNCLYGFAQMILSGDARRKKALILQSVCTLIFLGLCILACFTAFWRDGSIQVSALSAILMSVFFVLFGVIVGVFAGSFTLGKGKFASVWIPAAIAATMTLLMYIGEMILLNGHLYRLGTGALFRRIPWIVLAPVDLAIIFMSGCTTALIFSHLNRNQ